LFSGINRMLASRRKLIFAIVSTGPFTASVD